MPVIVVPEIVRVLVPVLVRITTIGLEDVPTVWFPKVRLAMLSETVGDGVKPVP